MKNRMKIGFKRYLACMLAVMIAFTSIPLDTAWGGSVSAYLREENVILLDSSAEEGTSEDVEVDIRHTISNKGDRATITVTAAPSELGKENGVSKVTKVEIHQNGRNKKGRRVDGDWRFDVKENGVYSFIIYYNSKDGEEILEATSSDAKKQEPETNPDQNDITDEKEGVISGDSSGDGTEAVNDNSQAEEESSGQDSSDSGSEQGSSEDSNSDGSESLALYVFNLFLPVIGAQARELTVKKAIIVEYEVNNLFPEGDPKDVDLEFSDERTEEGAAILLMATPSEAGMEKGVREITDIELIDFKAAEEELIEDKDSVDKETETATDSNATPSDAKNAEYQSSEAEEGTYQFFVKENGTYTFAVRYGTAEEPDFEESTNIMESQFLVTYELDSIMLKPRTSEDTYIRMDASNDPVYYEIDGDGNWTDFQIQKFGTERTSVAFGAAFDASGSSSNREVIITMPKGFRIVSAWDPSILSVLKNGYVRETTVDGKRIYTLPLSDEPGITSLGQVFVVTQDVPTLLNSLKSGELFEFEVTLKQGGVTEDVKAEFTAVPNTEDPEYVMEIIKADSNGNPVVVSPENFLYGGGGSHLLNSTSENLIPLYDVTNVIELAQSGIPGSFVIQVKKEPGTYVREGTKFTFPLPDTLGGTAIGAENLWKSDSYRGVGLYVKDENGKFVAMVTLSYQQMVDGGYSFDLRSVIGTNFYQVGTSGKTLAQFFTEASEFYILLAPNLYENRLDYQATGTLAGPAQMGTVITYEARDAKLKYPALDEAQTIKDGTYVNPNEKGLTFRFKNGSDTELKFGEKSAGASLAKGILQGSVSSSIPESILKKPSREYAVHTNFKVTWKWEEAFSPRSFSIPKTRFGWPVGSSNETPWSSVAMNNTYIFTVTNPVGGKRTVVMPVETWEFPESAFGFTGGEYISELSITSPLWNFNMGTDSQVPFSATYVAKDKLQNGTDVPADYMATVTRSIGSDQCPTLEAPYQVKLLEGKDNVVLEAFNFEGRSIVMNKHDGIDELGAYRVFKYPNTLSYPVGTDDFPVLEVEGAAITLTDLVTSDNQALVGYYDQDGTYVALAKESAFNKKQGATSEIEAEEYRGTVKTAHDVSQITGYNLKAIFENRGSAYATKLVFEIENFAEWKVVGDRLMVNFYLYAQDIAPGYLGYDQTVGTAGLLDLGNTYPFTATWNCNYTNHDDKAPHKSAGGLSSRVKLGMYPDDMIVETLDYALTTGSAKDNWGPSDGTNVPESNVILSETFVFPGVLTNRHQMDYQKAYIDFAGTDPDAIALATGISFHARLGFNQAEFFNDITVEYTTNKQTGLQRVIRTAGSKAAYQPKAETTWYMELADLLSEGEYFTSIKVVLPDSAAYGWKTGGGLAEEGRALPSVGLARFDAPIPKEYPVSGLPIGTKEDINSDDTYDKLPVKVTSYFEDLFGTTQSPFEKNGLTARIGGQTMLVDEMVSRLTYTGSGGGVNQGGRLQVETEQAYQFSQGTRSLNLTQTVKPVFYYVVHKDFSWDGTAKVAINAAYPFDMRDCSSAVTFIPPGTTAGTTGNANYGILKVDLTGAEYDGLVRCGYSNANLPTIESGKYARIIFGLNVAYTAELSTTQVPVSGVWMDFPFERDENQNNSVVQALPYGIDTTNTTDGAPFGVVYGNDKDSEFPAKTTTPDSGIGTMFYMPQTQTQTIIKGSATGLLANATSNYAYQKGDTVTSKDYMAARQTGNELFGVDVTLIGPENTDTKDWYVYLPIPTKQDENHSEFSMKLTAMNTGGLAAVAKDGKYDVFFTEENNPSMNGIKQGQDDTSVYKKYTGTEDISKATAVKIHIPQFVQDGRATVHLSFQLSEPKNVIGDQRAYFTGKINYAKGNDWSGGVGGIISSAKTYVLGDFAIKGTVWKESDNNSLYDAGVDSVSKGTVMRVYSTDGKAVVQANSSVGVADANGYYALTIPHDGQWDVAADILDNQQMVIPFVSGGDNTNGKADLESWFNRTTKLARIDFTGDAAKRLYTQEHVLAGVAEKPIITFSPNDSVVHVGSNSLNTAISNNGARVFFDQLPESAIAALTDNGDSTATITGHKSGKVTGTAKVSDNYDGTTAKTFDITVYANAVYDVNGGESAAPVDSKKYYPSALADTEAVTVSSSVMTKIGYTHTGWNTKADGSGTAYSFGAVFNTGSIAADITLYATYEIIKYEVKFGTNSTGTHHKGSFEGGMSEFNTNAIYGRPVASMPVPKASAGYRFEGYKTMTSFSTTDELILSDGTVISAGNAIPVGAFLSSDQVSRLKLYEDVEFQAYFSATPVIKGNHIVLYETEEYKQNDLNIEVTDEDQNVNLPAIDDAHVDTDKVGTYQIKVMVDDTDGNIAEKYLYVQVVGKTKFIANPGIHTRKGRGLTAEQLVEGVKAVYDKPLDIPTEPWADSQKVNNGQPVVTTTVEASTYDTVDTDRIEKTGITISASGMIQDRAMAGRAEVERDVYVHGVPVIVAYDNGIYTHQSTQASVLEEVVHSGQGIMLRDAASAYVEYVQSDGSIKKITIEPGKIIYSMGQYVPLTAGDYEVTSKVDDSSVLAQAGAPSLSYAIGERTEKVVVADKLYHVMFETKEHGTIGNPADAVTTVAHGKTVTPPPLLLEEGYELDYWQDEAGNQISDLSGVPITDNRKFTAIFKLREFTVRFIGRYDRVIKTELVKYGYNATPPKDHSDVKSKRFAGWSKSYQSIKEDRDIYTTYWPRESRPVGGGDVPTGPGVSKPEEVLPEIPSIAPVPPSNAESNQPLAYVPDFYPGLALPSGLPKTGDLTTGIQSGVGYRALLVDGTTVKLNERQMEEQQTKEERSDGSVWMFHAGSDWKKCILHIILLLISALAGIYYILRRRKDKQMLKNMRRELEEEEEKDV